MIHLTALVLAVSTGMIDPDTHWDELEIARDDGQTTVTVDGVAYSPEQFVAAIEQTQRYNHDRPFLMRLFNITSWFNVIWVAIGFGGQILFTVRLLVQWLASEKKRASVIPVAYWWCSIVGAGMLIAYFTWRQDIVGVLGQAFGWFIYIRNLYFIYAQQPEQEVLA